MKAVAIASGGMDSATLAYYYKDKGYDLILVGFNYGQRHKRELESLKTIATELDADCRIIDLSILSQHLHGSSLTSSDVAVPDGHYAKKTMQATVVPNRNAIMLAIATGIAVAEGAEIVATGVHAGDHFIYPDCRPEFIQHLDAAFRAGNEEFAVEGFHIEAPFVSITKGDIARLGIKLKVPYEKTWSCYKGGDIHCGRCGTCVERVEAFIEAQADDPTEYADRAFALAEIEKANA